MDDVAGLVLTHLCCQLLAVERPCGSLHLASYPCSAKDDNQSTAAVPEKRMQWRISRMPSHVHALTLDTHHGHSHTSLMWCGWVYWHGVVNARRPRRRDESKKVVSLKGVLRNAFLSTNFRLSMTVSLIV